MSNKRITDTRNIVSNTGRLINEIMKEERKIEGIEKASLETINSLIKYFNAKKMDALDDLLKENMLGKDGSGIKKNDLIGAACAYNDVLDYLNEESVKAIVDGR